MLCITVILFHYPKCHLVTINCWSNLIPQFHSSSLLFHFLYVNSYNNCDIYFWNIDGLSEHEILIVLRQMEMAATAYLTESDDHNAAQLLLTGYTDTLKYWWENFLTEKERFYVSNSINEDGEQDAVLKLVYAITKHFVGDRNVFA